MKSKIFIISLLLIIGTFSEAQEEIEEKILKIRNEFNKIESNLKNCSKKQFTYIEKNNERETKFEAFYLPYGRLVKLVENSNYKFCEQRLEYYCKENAVFFIFIQEKRNDGSQCQRRIYYDDNHKVIRDLYKEKAANDKRDFSKIQNLNNEIFWTNLVEVFGHAFFGNISFENYFSYPVFENIQDNEMKIKKIKEEYGKIESLRNKGSLKEFTVDYIDSVAYWNNTRYTAWYDDQSRLVLLTYGVGEEGYFSENQIYFKDRKPFFAFTTNSEPDNSQSEIRIYIYNDLVVKSLIKKKSPDDSRDFPEIENEENNDFLKDMEQASKSLINGIESEVSRLFKGFESENDN